MTEIAAFACALFVVLCWIPRTVSAQSASGTLSGSVTDTSGAVIQQASITLVDTATGIKSVTVANGTGFFSFAAVHPGNYQLTITAEGFANWVGTDITIHLGENKDVPHIVLPVASTSANVEVTTSEAATIPLDNGASSTTINSTMVQELSIQGRDAAELIKLMPGMAMNTGLGQGEFNSLITTTNGGPIGDFSASGTQPYGSMQMTLDGANLTDTGNQGNQIANVNQDTTAEFTYVNAAFGADTPRGPSIIQISSKGGGKGFHGDVYTYLRNWQLNANDPYIKAALPGTPRSISHQTYPGGTIGGPVLIPGTHFNHNRDKLFFFAGFEKMIQDPAATLHLSAIPTTAMINGDFSAASLPGDQAPVSSGANLWPSSQIPCAAAASWTSFCPYGGGPNPFPNGQIPSSYWDSDGRALLSYFNKVAPPNLDPATNNGFNYQFLDHPPVNRWELRLRGDYNATAKDKVSVIYTQQNQADINNFGAWWIPAWAVPLPTPMVDTTESRMWTANYVRVFNATTTNEFSFAYTYFTFPPAFADPKAMTASTYGYTTEAPFDTSSTDSFDQLPAIMSWGGSAVGLSSGSFPGTYPPAMIKAFGNAYGNVKRAWSYQDNLTRVIGRHSLKAGFFWDSNVQIATTGWAGNFTQGGIEFDNWSNYTTGNPVADILTGHTDGMQQGASAPVQDMDYNEWALYAQDQWHITRKITLDLGFRFDHEGQWYPVNGNGLTVFDPSTYDNTAGAPAWTGMSWHQINSSIPQSGFISRLLYPDTRVGGAYDLIGNGKTVIRGGFGIYRWQISDANLDPSLDASENVNSIVTPSTSSFAQLATLAPTVGGSWCALSSTCASGSDAITKGESATPYTMNWDAMVDQALPYRTVFELQYIGNKTADALLTGEGNQENFYANINKIPLGGLYGTDALTGVNYWQQSCSAGVCGIPNSSYYNGYRPYANYGVLNILRHGSYSNYNGMVAALQKQTGKATFLVNYTFSKVLGIRDGQIDNGGGDGPTVDPFNLRANYGPLAYDRTHLFNASYYINLPGSAKANKLVKTAVNGWQLSGDTQMQSGPPLQPNTGGNMNVTWEPGSNGATAGNVYLLGTNAPLLVPYLTCDPRHGGGKYFNASCFATPSTLGKNGPAVWPYIKGPAFFVSDLAIFKSVYFTETRYFQFRVSAFNFLNHPLPQFGQGSDVNLDMGCNQSSTKAAGCDLGGSNLNTTTNGNVQYKAAAQNRIMELALKYYF